MESPFCFLRLFLIICAFPPALFVIEERIDPSIQPSY